MKLSDIVGAAKLLLSSPSGDSHAERMESFYRAQARSYDSLREGFLHGRDLLLKECARLSPRGGVWVDIGGGTARNVLAMREYRDLADFERIYIVDISPSMCEVAREAIARAGIDNVEVVCADASSFTPPSPASLVSFSYSLSMIPEYYRTIDHVLSYLGPDGHLGVVDFYVPRRDEAPERTTVGYTGRWLWRAWFDLDRIDVGPERRAYLDHKLSGAFEFDARARISWAPLLEVPYFVAVKRRRGASPRPRFRYRDRPRPSWRFGNDFIYNISFEDPALDKRHLGVGSGDHVLMLTSGGCNAFEWLLEDAAQVTTTDINPAQNFLVELKCAIILALEQPDIWKLLGEGRHPHIRRLFERELQWHLSPPARDYWRARLHYFDDGLYRHGGTGRGLTLMRNAAQLLAGRDRSVLDRFLAAQSVEEQQDLWRGHIRPLMVESGLLRALANPAALWFGIGVPRNQWRQVIEGRSPEEYFDAVAEAICSHGLLRTNHFWRWFFTGDFVPECCPRYLLPDNLAKLKDGRLARLEVRHGTFLAALREGRHDKLILGDHLDWYGPRAVERVIGELSGAIDESARLLADANHRPRTKTAQAVMG